MILFGRNCLCVDIRVDLVYTWLVVSLVAVIRANQDAKRLYDDLMRKNNYDKTLRPVLNYSDKQSVKLGLKLSQILDVDERNEIISLNMWVMQEWRDMALRWDPKQYGDVDILYVPAESLWIPDIVLYNNADGEYTVTILTKAAVKSNGDVKWAPPAIFKSYCSINVKFFPFDEQVCHMKFGFWSYDGLQVDIRHELFDKVNASAYIENGKGIPENATLQNAVDVHDFYPNLEWDIMEVIAKKNIIKYPCCDEPYPDITFNITLRRKTLYYTVHLIIPCVALNMLTILAFYLPVACGEKITLCISILLSLSLFQLLLMELIPPTSITMPLLGTYILFTCFVISISVFSSVVVLNIHFRSSSVVPMPQCARKIFLHVLPDLLFMKRPVQGNAAFTVDMTGLHCDLSNYDNPYRQKFRRLYTDQETESEESYRSNTESHVTSSFIGYTPEYARIADSHLLRNRFKFPPNVLKALEGILFVAKHSSEDERKKRIKNEWAYFAMVLDRLLLISYFAVCVIGALTILLNAPVLYDNRKPLV